MSELLFRLLEHSIDAGWTVLALLLLRLLLKKAPRWITVLMWTLVAIRLVLPVHLESPVSLMPQVQLLPASAELFYGSGLVGTMPSTSDGTTVLQWLLPGAWLLGMAVMLGSMAISWLRLHRRLREAVRLQDKVYQSERIASPFVLGFLRPRIYLPYHISKQDLPHILAHENAHIRRRDHWWKPIGYVLLAVYWFHPLIWLAYILLCRDIELACDEKVIRQLDSTGRADYSQALLRAQISRRTVTACPLAFGEAGVKERVKNVLNYKKPGFWILLTVVVACAVAAVCLLTDPAAPKTDTPMVQAPQVTAPEATAPTHSNTWLSEQAYVPDSTCSPELISAVEAELNCYAQQNLPEKTTRVFSYALYSVGYCFAANAGENAKLCQVDLQLMLKDYTLRQTAPGGITSADEKVVPVKITFAVDDGSYYKTGFTVAESPEQILAEMPQAAKELLYAEEAVQQKRLEKLRRLCEEKLLSCLRGEVSNYTDVSSNTAVTAEYDLNGDGSKETYYLATRVDGDIFTFLLGIRMDGVPAYQKVFSSSPAALRFEVGEDGVLLHSDPKDGSPDATYRITVQNEKLLLTP